ncbi:hypothetical protein [Actinomyces provencensis]|uniref:hypothetical protein n=1 Tax=Actinomyces provencensis TaxID=1720198 RepID=UPI001E28A9A0|nr:hypothetical protein [Actinomyces provencensis]
MSTPEIRPSTSHAPGLDATPVEPRRLHRRVIGIGLGFLLAALVYWVMPDQVPQAVIDAAPEGAEFTAHGLAVTAAVDTLMGRWWVTEAIPLAATALVPLVAFPFTQVSDFGTTAAPMPTARSSCSWEASSWRWPSSDGTCTVASHWSRC